MDALAKQAYEAREELARTLATIADALLQISNVMAESSGALDFAIKNEAAATSIYVAALEKVIAELSGAGAELH